MSASLEQNKLFQVRGSFTLNFTIFANQAITIVPEYGFLGNFHYCVLSSHTTLTVSRNSFLVSLAITPNCPGSD